MYKNDMIIHDDYVEMIICNKNKQEKARVLISLEDLDEVGKYRWSINGRGYIVTGGGKISLHRFIMNPPEGKVVDHKNHNPLDNRRKNLRICTQQQNSMNTSVSSISKTGYKGVSYEKRLKKFRASIQYKGDRTCLGFYKTPEIAAIVYDKAAILLDDDFYETNFDRDYYIIIDNETVVTYYELIDSVIEELGGLSDESIDYSNADSIPDII